MTTPPCRPAAVLLSFVCLCGAVSACRDHGATPHATTNSAAPATASAPALRDTAPDRQIPSPEASASSAAATPSFDKAVHVGMPAEPPAPHDRPDAAGPDANRSIFSEYGFPGAPDLVHLCGQRVYQPGGEHLTWDAFASEEAPAALVAHYQDWLGKRGFEAQGEGGIWRVPAGAPSPDRTLEILPAGAPGPYTACDTKAPASAKSVIVISRR